MKGGGSMTGQRSLITFLLVFAVLASETAATNDFSYDVPHYSVYIRDITLNAAYDLDRQGFTVEWAHDDKAMFYVNAEQEELLRYLGYIPLRTEADEPLIPYPTLTEIYDSIDSVLIAHPDICRGVTIGTSVQGRPIRAVVVSDNPATEEIEPEMRIHGGIHGNEPAASTTTLHYLEVLTDEYLTSPMCEYIINNTETWIVPVLNPDGYVADNRYNANGVDLNRNLSYMWVPWSTHGPYPFSEPETAALRDITMQSWPEIENFINPFTAGLSLHTGANCFNSAWNYTENPLPEDVNLMYVQGDDYANSPGIVAFFGSGGFLVYIPGSSWYSTNGDVNDWSYGECGTIDHTIEVYELHQYPDWPALSNAHYMAILSFFTNSTYGIWGTVTNNLGTPLDAQITISTTDRPVRTQLRFCRTDVILGDYHKTLLPGTYDVQVTAEGYVPKTVTDVLVSPEERVEVSFVLDMLGIEEGETGGQSLLGNLTVFPNPVFNSCEIRLPVTGVDGTVNIFSLTGRLVYRLDVSSQTTSIDWDCMGENRTEIPSGVYVVKFNSGGISMTERFIINR